MLERHNHKTLLSLLLITFMVSPFARAQDSSLTPVQASNTPQTLAANATVLDPIEVIVDEETPVTGEVYHEEFTGSHQRIHDDELKRRDITIADILSHESGVQSRQSGGFGTFSSMTVRAATAAQTGVYLDGVLLNSGANAVIDLSMLELLTVDTVDVYRGATPAQLGFGSIGGAINFKSTSALNKGPSTVSLFGGGSFGTQRAQLLHSSKHGAFDVVGAFSYQQSENNYPFLNDNGTPLNAQDDISQSRNNADARRSSGMVRSGLQWGLNSRSDVLLQITGRELGIPDRRNSASNEADLDTNNLRMHLNHTINNIGNWNSRYSLYWHNDDEVFNDQLSQIGLGAQHTESITNSSGFSAYWEHLDDFGSSSISTEIRRETENANDFIDPQFDFQVERQSVNASFNRSQYAMSDRLLLTTGLSLQFLQDEYKRIARLNESSYSASALSPSIGFRFDKSSSLSIRSNLGRYYREPSFGELFGSRGFFEGNNDLAAEEGNNADIGFTWKPRTWLTIESSLFASWREELIATVFDARGIGRAINVGKARIVGVEVGADWKLSERFSFRANFTSQDAKSLQDFDTFNEKQLPGEAKHVAYFRLQFAHGGLRTFVEANGSRERYYDQANKRPADNYWLQNLGIEWQRGRWTIAGSVNNISDQNVEDFYGFLRPGRAFSFTVTTRL